MEEGLYGTVLFLHVMSVIALFAAITIEHTGGGRIRRAETVADLRRWVAYVQVTEFIFPVATLGLIVTGVWLALDRFSLEVGWVGVSFALLVVMAIGGPLIQGRKLKALHRELEGAPDGQATAEQLAAARSPLVWGSVFAMSGAAVGIIVNMTVKPEMAAALAWPVALALLGIIGGLMSARGAARG